MSNPLEESFLKAFSDPTHIMEFYRELVNSVIYIIQPSAPDIEGERTLEEDEELQVQNVEIEGEPYIPVFTSVEALEKVAPPDSGYFGINALDFMHISEGSQWFMNLGQDCCKPFVAEELQTIANGEIWEGQEDRVIEAGTEISIGEPEVVPTELLAALSKYFATNSNVICAYNAHIDNASSEEPAHTLIAIESKGDWEKLMAQVIDAIEGVPVPDPPIDFLPLDGDSGLEDYFAEEQEPFYSA